MPVGGAVTVLQQHRYELIGIVACRVAKSKTTNHLSMTTTLSSFTKYYHFKMSEEGSKHKHYRA